MKLTVQLQAPILDISGYKAALDRELGQAIRDAARTYLETVLAIIPIWSGASVGTFTDLAAAIQYPLSITPAPGISSRIALGASQGDGTLRNDGRGRHEFSYSTTLPHLVYNEYNNANQSPDSGLFSQLINPGPYFFQAQAESVVTAELRAADVPDIEPFIRIAQI